MYFLKNRSAWLLALVLPILLFARGAMAEEWTNLDDEIMKRGTVRIGIGYISMTRGSPRDSMWILPKPSAKKWGSDTRSPK